MSGVALHYVVLYVAFGVVFLAAIVAYWVVTRVLSDPRQVYLAE